MRFKKNFDFISIAIGAIIGVAITLMCISLPQNKPILQPKCSHLTEIQAVAKYEAYSMFVDSMQYCKKKDVSRFTDSLIKYRIK